MPRALLTCGLSALALGAAVEGQSRSVRAREELGQKLFDETEIGNPGFDFVQRCSGCHFVGKDPRGGGERFYAEDLERSLLPSMASGQQLETLRNTPTLLDLDLMGSYGWDGHYGSLEELLRADRLLKASPHTDQHFVEEWLLATMARARAA